MTPLVHQFRPIDSWGFVIGTAVLAAASVDTASGGENMNALRPIGIVMVLVLVSCGGGATVAIEDIVDNSERYCGRSVEVVGVSRASKAPAVKSGSISGYELADPNGNWLDVEPSADKALPRAGDKLLVTGQIRCSRSAVDVYPILMESKRETYRDK
jgi:hypothetical protein